MRIKIGSGVFAPRLISTIITLLLLPVLLELGGWQVHRLYWKRELLASIDAHIHRAPVDIVSIDLNDANYTPVTADGVFLNDKELFVFATELKTGQGGYHVLTPLRLTSGKLLLVDRGWVPYDLKPGGFSRPEDEVHVQGILHIPTRGLFQPHDNPAKNEWYGVDFAAMAEADGLAGFIPLVLEADETPNPGGYPVGGQTRLDLPNDHFSYAVTWFSFAALLVIIYVLSGYKKRAD